MIWCILGSCPAVACFCPEIAQEAGYIGRTICPLMKKSNGLTGTTCSFFVCVCMHSFHHLPPVCGFCVPRGTNPRFDCKWISIWRSDLLCHVAICLDVVFYLSVFFPSGRCVVVGGSCRMEEHSLLSDSPCSWRLRYPMSLFTDNVFISIFFMCN